ncbi:MAG: tetratricopeptide repeat protein [Pseudomonadota bacterium]
MKKSYSRILVTLFLYCIIGGCSEVREFLPTETPNTIRIPTSSKFYQADIYYKNGNYEKCLQELKQLLTTNKNDPYVHYNLGLAYSRLKKNFLAKTEYELALASQLTEDIPEIYKELGGLYRRQHLYEQAVDVYSKALKIVPGSREIRNCLVNAYQETGNMELAIRECKRKPRLYFTLGNLYCRLGRYDDALAAYTKATLEDNPNRRKTYNNIGIAYGKKGDAQQALQFYQRALEEDPRYIPPHINMGILHRSIGKYDLAEKHYLQALSIASDCQAALLNLGILYDIYMNKQDEAIKNYQRYCQLGGPRSAEVREWIETIKQRKQSICAVSDS